MNQEDEEKIGFELKNLMKAVTSYFETRIKSGMIIISDVHNRVPILTNVKYSEAGNTFNMSSNNASTRITKNWDINDRIAFNNDLKALIEYQECKEQLIEIVELLSDKADFFIERFIWHITQLSIEGASREDIEKCISILLNDIRGDPVEWTFLIWINGMWLKEDEVFDIANGIIIRRPIQNDLFDMLDLRDDAQRAWGLTTCIIEGRLNYKEIRELVLFEQKLISVLSLYHVGSVKALKTIRISKSLTQGIQVINSPSLLSPNISYGISSIDAPELRQFISTNIEKIPISWDRMNLDKKKTPLIISLERYNDSIYRFENADSRTTSAITCLESLFLKGGEDGELSHKLSQRTAALFRLFGIEPLEVFRDVKKAYDIRSKFIHGQMSKKKNMIEIQKLSERIVNYARMSLVVFIQLSPEYWKDDIVEMLDLSLLDENVMNEIRDIMSKKAVSVPMNHST